MTCRICSDDAPDQQDFGMFARRLRLTLAGPDGAAPAPKAWLDQFFMRSFTGYSAFDETLPAADGMVEAGNLVDVEEVRAQFEKWLRGRKMIDGGTRLVVEELARRD